MEKKIYIRFSNGFTKEVEYIQDANAYATYWGETNYTIIYR
jgi:hypothetical protein